MSVLEDFSALYTAITGNEPDERLTAAVREACDMSCREDDDFPAFLRQAAIDLANRRTREPTEIAERDRSFAWLLQYLSPALPDTVFDMTSQGDVFFVPRLGLAMVTRTGERTQTFEILPWSHPEASGTSEPIILNTFSPTDEQIRRWAYDPAVHFTQQDEELAIDQVRHVPLLLDLADDPACPKRGLILTIAAGVVLWVHYHGFDRELLAGAGEQARRARSLDLKSWGADLAEIERFIDAEPRPVTHEESERIAQMILRGVHRPGMIVTEDLAGPPWCFTGTHSFNGRRVSELRVHPETGALEYSELPALVRVKLTR